MEQNQHFLLANIDDKIKLANRTNKIKNTSFLTIQERVLVEKHLKSLNEENYLFHGGFSDAERQVLIVYSSKFDDEIVKRDVSNILIAIRIILPKETVGQYTHKDYLSCLMRIGLERERFGDIIVFDDEAYVVVLKENVDYIVESLKHFTRFQKAIIDAIPIAKIKLKERSFLDMRVVVSSNRLDNFVAELAKCSRKQAEDMLFMERVLVNNETTIKQTKVIKEGDIITIRGKGKFIIEHYLGENKKERKIFEVKEYQ